MIPNNKISIIIPAYNVEDYIRRCIMSIVTQPVPQDCYEIIVVDDGSTDNTRRILLNLQANYPFIRIIDKFNGGASSARNEGLKYASGDYILFIDSDDWIADDSLSFLLKWMKEYPVDILMFGVCEIYDDGKRKLLNSHLSDNNKVLAAEDYMMNFTLRSSSCMSLFHRDIFFIHNVRLREGFLTEDDDLIVKAFSVSERVVCNNRTVYYYYQRSGSVSKETNENHARKLIGDKVRLLIDLTGYVENFKGNRKKGLERKLNFLAVDILRLLIRKNQSEEFMTSVLNELRKAGYYPLKRTDYSIKYKIFRFIFNHSLSFNILRPFKKYI